MTELEARIKDKYGDGERCKRRIETAVADLKFAENKDNAGFYDKVVVNSDLDAAFADLTGFLGLQGACSGKKAPESQLVITRKERARQKAILVLAKHVGSQACKGCLRDWRSKRADEELWASGVMSAQTSLTEIPISSS
eukprot:TRINITY_DN2361_c0_g2_i2.p2 TRINITY_DN2361_c0_g2~~TRINITY_DN2361_c0_g2_i2.p2  ORF type:complete len:139 (-),score=21.38 TRINITY_DN2361_c0_g2_i2:160-576(-)